MPKINDYFDKVYVINLPFRTDRRKEMQYEFDKIGVNASDVYFFPAVRPDEAGGFPSIGARGCFLSHLGVLEDAMQNNCRQILIVEDDLNFVDDFNQAMAAAMTNLETTDWSIFYAGYVLPSDFTSKLDKNDQVVQLPPDLAVSTTHFMAIKGDAIVEIHQYLFKMLAREPGDKMGGPMHVDGAYSWFRKDNPAHNTFIANPELGYQRSSRTDIADLRWFDRVFGIRHVVMLLRKFIN